MTWVPKTREEEDIAASKRKLPGFILKSIRRKAVEEYARANGENYPGELRELREAKKATMSKRTDEIIFSSYERGQITLLEEWIERHANNNSKLDLVCIDDVKASLSSALVERYEFPHSMNGRTLKEVIPPMARQIFIDVVGDANGKPGKAEYSYHLTSNTDVGRLSISVDNPGQPGTHNSRMANLPQPCGLDVSSPGMSWGTPGGAMPRFESLSGTNAIPGLHMTEDCAVHVEPVGPSFRRPAFEDFQKIAALNEQKHELLRKLREKLSAEESGRILALLHNLFGEIDALAKSGEAPREPAHGAGPSPSGSLGESAPFDASKLYGTASTPGTWTKPRMGFEIKGAACKLEDTAISASSKPAYDELLAKIARYRADLACLTAQREKLRAMIEKAANTSKSVGLAAQLVHLGTNISSLECEIAGLTKEALAGVTIEPTKRTLGEWAKICHETSASKGWWDGIKRQSAEVLKDVPAKIALIHSEVSEALEDFRKMAGETDEEMYKNLIGFYYEPDKHGHLKPVGFASELADVHIRLFDLERALGIDIDRAVAEKNAYNQKREHRHGGKVI